MSAQAGLQDLLNQANAGVRTGKVAARFRFSDFLEMNGAEMSQLAIDMAAWINVSMQLDEVSWSTVSWSTGDALLARFADLDEKAGAT